MAEENEDGAVQKETKCVEFKAGLWSEDFPTILECDDSVFEVALNQSEEKFELRRTIAKAEDPLFPLGKVLTGDSLIVYESGLVILCNEKGAVFAISCTNGPF